MNNLMLHLVILFGPVFITEEVVTYFLTFKEGLGNNPPKVIINFIIKRH